MALVEPLWALLCAHATPHAPRTRDHDHTATHAAAKHHAGQPYVIVFCGVNGVGKSTNLAKIAYWLGQQGLRVQLAACDTFRSGAVEQLKTHAARLGVSACAAAWVLLLVCGRCCCGAVSCGKDRGPAAAHAARLRVRARAVSRGLWCLISPPCRPCSSSRA
jgi:hypothetical protein